jgi:Fungal specific transcription factor domain
MLYIIDHTYTQFAHVQCFALLSTFLASLNRLPQAWLLVGQAIRTAQDLGLHRSPRPLNISKVDKETRRKVWWCVYGLDRCLAVRECVTTCLDFVTITVLRIGEATRNGR